MYGITSFSIKRLLVTALAATAAVALAAPAAQADTLHATDDAYVALGGKKKKKNFGKTATLVVNEAGAGQEAYLKFDLSPVPAGATVDQALLRIWVGKVKNKVPGGIEARLVGGPDWSEDTITGLTVPTVSTVVDTVTFEKADQRDFATFDITTAVQAWTDSVMPSSNFGVVLVPVLGSAVNVTFDSKESVKTSHQPELEVVVTATVSGGSIAPNSINSGHIVNETIGQNDIGRGGVATSEIADGSIGSVDIADGQGLGVDIRDGTIEAVDIATDAVDSLEVKDNSLKAIDLGPSSVGTSEVALNSLTADDLGSGSVGTSEVALNSLTANDLGSGSVGTSEVALNSLTADDLATNSVAAAEIASGAVGTSEVALNSLTADDLGTNSVAAAEIAAGAVGVSELSNAAKGVGINLSMVVPAAAFVPINEGQQYDRIVTGGYLRPGVDSFFVSGLPIQIPTCFHAPVNLPDGVNISSFQVTFQDAQSIWNLLPFSLRRTILTTTTAATNTLATITPGNVFTGNVQLRSTSSITSGFVDADRYAYSIDVCGTHSLHRIYGARIFYN